MKKVVRGNCGKRDEKRLETLYVDALPCCQYNTDQSQGRLAIKRRTNLVNKMHSLHLNITYIKDRSEMDIRQEQMGIAPTKGCKGERIWIGLSFGDCSKALFIMRKHQKLLE